MMSLINKRARNDVLWFMVYGCKLVPLDEDSEGIEYMETEQRCIRPLLLGKAEALSNKWAKEGWLVTLSPVENGEFIEIYSTKH